MGRSPKHGQSITYGRATGGKIRLPGQRAAAIRFRVHANARFVVEPGRKSVQQDDPRHASRDKGAAPAVGLEKRRFPVSLVFGKALRVYTDGG